MSDDGDRTCPLCAEEMDITDQQLKPCKCGYDICVWCWHHIIDMAEKDETEGRCPACRTPYDKDRIVNMAPTCERTVAEKNTEKKQKAQRVKPKAAVAAAPPATAEAKKHLSGVRVIQRNLVYIIGLPSNLCNESVLERREYFGQYGKVLKVSVSRPTGPPSQQASGNTNISVYITFAKEEEAIRCIQAVHNFVLEGKVLRACFGTTKYCHAWLRNMTCGNPDCLYLHDVGSQEDSFTKDEIISAYTRTRVPQMVPSVSQRRAGTVLPPPADDFSYSAVVSARHNVKNGIVNTTYLPRLSPPNSCSGRATLPPAASWGHHDLTARTTGAGVTSSESLIKSKSEPQSTSFLSSSTFSSTRIPSSWNDDSSSVPKISEEHPISEKESSSKTIELYKPGILKETQALSSLSSSLDIDFSTIPSAWTDDDNVVDEKSKGSEENQVSNGNEKLTHPGSKSPKKDIAVSSTRKSPSNFVSSLMTSKSDVKIVDGDHLVTNIAPKSPASKDVNCHLAGGKNILEDAGPQGAYIDTLSSVMLDVKNEVQSMAGNQQPDAMPCTSVAGLLSLENKNSVHSYQYDSDKHLDWNLELQSCATPLINSSLNSDKQPMLLLDGTDVPLYSSFIQLPDTSGTSLWDDTENNHILTTLSTTSMMQTKQSTTDNTGGLRVVYPSGNVSGHPGMGSHQPGAISVSTDNKGSSDKTINKDENRIISDILLSEFNLWDSSYSTANDFVRMLRESDNNDAPSSMPSWKLGTTSNESRFAFARQEDQEGMSDSSLRNCGSEKNFSFLSQNSYGNVYQNSLRFQSLENSLAMPDMAPSGTSRSKIPVPPGFSVPVRVAPPGFSSGFPSQDGLNPPPGFSSEIPSRDRSNPASRFSSAFSSGITLQGGSNPPSRFPSAFSSGFPSQDGLGSSSRFSPAFSSGLPSQDGPNSCSRFHPLVSSGFSSQDGSNPPSRFASAFSSGVLSQDGSSQVYGSEYSESRAQDCLLGGNGKDYEAQLARRMSDIEFVDPAILAVGKGRMPGIGDSGLEMKNTPAFSAQWQTSNNDQRIQLLMQQNMQPHQRTHIQDAFNTMNDNYPASQLLGQNQGSLSPYAQMLPQQPRSSHLTNGHFHGWSDLRQGNNTPVSDISGIMYPKEANNSHIMGSTDRYNRALGM